MEEGAAMYKVEKEIVKWIESNTTKIAFIAVILFGSIIRFSLRKYVSGDADTFLLPWYDEIRRNGSLRGLGIQVGNYNMLYQFFIAIFTYIPVPALYTYKIFSCIFDIALAIIGVLITREVLEKKDEWSEFVIFSVIYLSPIVFLNSACWAQCDSIYVFFLMCSIYLLLKEKYGMALFLFGIAVAFKLQALFLLPFLVIFYLLSKKFSILRFLNILIALIVTAIPNLLAGRKITEIFTIYDGQINDSMLLSRNYPSFWNLLYNETIDIGQKEMRNVAIIITICILGIFCVWIMIKNIKRIKSNYIWIAFLLAYMSVLFLPTMHERYGYLYEILAACILIIDKSTCIYIVPLYIVTFITYGHYLFNVQYNLIIISLVNVCIFIIYLIHFVRIIRKQNGDLELRRKNYAK